MEKHTFPTVDASSRSRFRFDRDSRDAIAAAGTDVPTVLSALHGDHPKVRRHVGNGRLHLYVSTPNGQWLAMAFVETQVDEEWLLTTIRTGSAAR